MVGAAALPVPAIAVEADGPIHHGAPCRTSARRYPLRTLTRMIGFDPTNRYRRRDTRLAFERMETDGVIEMESSGGGRLIYGGPNW